MDPLTQANFDRIFGAEPAPPPKRPITLAMLGARLSVVLREHDNDESLSLRLSLRGASGRIKRLDLGNTHGYFGLDDTGHIVVDMAGQLQPSRQILTLGGLLTKVKALLEHFPRNAKLRLVVQRGGGIINEQALTTGHLMVGDDATLIIHVRGGLTEGD